MDTFNDLLVLLIFIAIFFLVWRKVKKVTVFEYQRGLKYKKGKFEKVLEPGAYWIYAPSTHIAQIDMRRSYVSVAGQEVLTADSISLRVSIAAEYEIADPAAATHSVDNYYSALYTILQIAAREVIGQAKIDHLLENRAVFGEKLLELSAGKAEEFGLKLLSASLKDLMFPGDLKKVFAQEVQARKEGIAALEKARGETAALRNLANAAKLVDSNPALMQLRLIQSLGESSGNTLVFAMPASDIIKPSSRPAGGPSGADPSNN